ncbi:MAG: type I restriction enzyme HsdR N-terminal domain-containing protein [Bacteroidota bacterium]|nr:type I restriction enzyme HsdR N-terminal domain-containing protein [Bacteroidota bacterium]
MLVINYPEPGFRIKKEKGVDWLFDPIRKKWLLLTPEEWVRQNFVQYLIQVKNYPAALIALEKELGLGELKKRFDILVYDRNHQPWMMIECKEMNVKLDETVLQQVLRYNISIPVRFLVITNGNYALGWEKVNNQLQPVSDLPLID